MKNLAGKNVLVTGGANGIGRAVVNKFLEEGCTVWVIDKDEVKLALLRETEKVIPIILDITDEEKVKSLISSLPLDILVNNAAITEGDNYKAVMDVNCNGTRYVTEAVLPGMKTRGVGNIIFITSVHTAMAFIGDASYDGSKHWAVGYMRARAVELAGTGIRVNAVAPGAIQNAGPNTDVLAIEEGSKKIPMKRFGNPEEIASVVTFVASDEASYITGTEIRVDGGLSVQSPFRD